MVFFCIAFERYGILSTRMAHDAPARWLLQQTTMSAVWASRLAARLAQVGEKKINVLAQNVLEDDTDGVLDLGVGAPHQCPLGK